MATCDSNKTARLETSSGRNIFEYNTEQIPWRVALSERILNACSATTEITRSRWRSWEYSNRTSCEYWYSDKTIPIA